MGNNIKELIATVLILVFIGSVIWSIEQRSHPKKVEEPTIDRTDSILKITDQKIDEVASFKEEKEYVIDSLKKTINVGKKKSKVEVENLKTQVESLAQSENNWRNEATNLKAIPAEKKVIYEKRIIYDTAKVEIPVVVQVIDTIHVNDTTKFKQVFKNKFKLMKK